MSSNKIIKGYMTRKYGAKCMIEEAGVRSKEEVEKDFKKYTGKKQKYIMNELTYHHILEKYKGGKATEENGAILRNINHIWFNSLPKEKQKEINEILQEYKRNYNKNRSFSIATVQITNGRVVQAEVIKPEEAEEYVYVPVYEGTQEEYEKYIKARRERIKEKWANARRNMEEER